MNKAIEFIKSLNIPSEYIIVGCSGGPDSMCLLNILHEEGYKVICAHVNHNIREESKKEYKFLNEYCKKKNIIFEGLEIPPLKDKNESFYRKKRYTFYKDLADKYRTKYIMTAHHGDDLIETVLMRITRGSHLKGYMGFSKFYDERGYKIVKPLVYYSKDEILSYLELNGIPFVLDKTNDEDVYTRNKYRHHVLPFLKSISPNIHLKYLKYSEELEKASDFIERQVIDALDKNYLNQTINIKEFLKLDRFIQEKELEYIFKDLYRDDIDKIKKYHIESILDNLVKNKNFILDLPLGYKIIVEYNILKITIKNNTVSSYEYTLETNVILPDSSEIILIEDSSDTSNFTTRLSSKDLKLPLIVRPRMDGDKIYIKNMTGSKKVKSVMIDEKIAPSLRDAWPLVVDQENNVVWIPGLRKSKFDNEKDKKYDIILKYKKERK